MEHAQDNPAPELAPCPGKRPRARPSVPARGLICLARVYQATLSTLIGRHCRFVPTCSEYFIQAVEKQGAVRGTLKGLGRILRCHPFGKSGYDPVE